MNIMKAMIPHRVTGKLFAACLVMSGWVNPGWADNASAAADAMAARMQQQLQSLQLPAFPEFPAPQETLGEKDQGTIFYRTKSPYDFDVVLRDYAGSRETTGVGYLVLPEKASRRKPVAAMIILHGSGGISPGREFGYARMLADNGYAAFVLDYYLPRGITPKSPYMLATTSVTEFDAVTDAYNAMRLLSTHPLIDGKRIGVMGFSYGGMATRLAMDERFRQVITPEHPGFAAHADYYGPCFQILGTGKTNGAPLLTLRGTEDNSVTIADCQLREAEMRALGVKVTAEVYEGAGHAWDTGVPRRLYQDYPYIAGCDVVYDEDGIPFVNGKKLIDPSPGSTPAERQKMRIRTAGVLGRCAGQGYVIGWDPQTRAKSDAALLRFLRQALK
ncbi:MAG: dienelactone hydrolase [Gammaproteobacteria bacterium]|nr:MAG: dienelactone hydrolase [Gammaproteobacteria bacterium]